MTVTAFQPSAFQNDAFQIIGEEGAGSVGNTGAMPLSSPDRQITIDYEKYRRLGGKKLLAIVDPFINALNKKELEKRRNARFITPVAPSAKRIDFHTLLRNQLARLMLEAEIARIQQMQREEEEFLLVLLLSI